MDWIALEPAKRIDVYGRDNEIVGIPAFYAHNIPCVVNLVGHTYSAVAKPAIVYLHHIAVQSCAVDSTRKPNV